MIEIDPITMKDFVSEYLVAHTPPIIGSLDNPDDINSAIEQLNQGKPIAFQYRRVFGIAVNCADSKSIQTTLSIKSDPDLNRPFSGMIKTETFIEYVDKDNIHPQLVPHFSDITKFKSEISTLFHVRSPITHQATNILPKSMYTTENTVSYMHNLDSHGHPISNLTKAAYDAGIVHFGVTTANRSRIQPEITNLEDLLSFLSACDTNGEIALVLKDPTPTNNSVMGSWGIIDISKRPDGKLTGIRHGHVPFKVIEKVLNIEIDTTNAKPAAYPQADFSAALADQNNCLSPAELRSLVLGYIHQK